MKRSFLQKKYPHLRYFRLMPLVVVVIGIFVTIYSINNARYFISKAQELNQGQFQSQEQLIQSGRLKAPEKILLIDVYYNKDTTPTLKLGQIKRKNGYLPTISQTGEYEVRLVDLQGQIVYQAPFVIPNEVAGPPPLPGDSTPDTVQLSEAPFSLVTPGMDNISEVQLAKGSTIISKTALKGKVEELDNQPNFNSIRGDELHPNLLNSLFPPTAAANDSYLDIVIIGDNYSDFSLFHSDVNKIASHILTYEPFKSRAAQIYFRYVDNSTDLECQYSPTVARLLYCNSQLVMQQVTNAAVPYDIVYVVVNSSEYGGSGGIIAAGYNGSFIGEMFAHESMGHSFGQLADEYTVYGNGPIDNQIHGLGSTSDGNCYAGTPPALAWQGLVSPSEYRLGCNYSNWYRSSSSSIMFTLSDTYFNKVSQAVLNRRLDSVAGVITPTPTPTLPSDSVMPTVSITSPLANSTVIKNSNVTITASAQDNVAVAKVDFYVNNSLVCSDSTVAYSCNWKVPGKRNTSYNLLVKAADTSGNIAQHSIVVFVQ